MERSFTLTGESGLHARPASLLVQTVQRFPDTQVTLKTEAREANGRSLIAVLALGAGAGSTVTVRCEGPSEAAAMEAIAALITGGLGG